MVGGGQCTLGAELRGYLWPGGLAWGVEAYPQVVGDRLSAQQSAVAGALPMGTLPAGFGDAEALGD